MIRCMQVTVSSCEVAVQLIVILACRNLLIYYRMRFPLKALSKVVERQFNEQEFLDSAKVS